MILSFSWSFLSLVVQILQMGGGEQNPWLLCSWKESEPACQGRGKNRGKEAKISLDGLERWRGGQLLRKMKRKMAGQDEWHAFFTVWRNSTENLNYFSMILDDWDGVSYECEPSRGRQESGPDFWSSQTRTTSRSPLSDAQTALWCYLWGYLWVCHVLSQLLLLILG